MKHRIASASIAAACAISAIVPATFAQAQQAPAPAPIEPAQSFEAANARASDPRWLSLTYAEFDTRGAEPAMAPDLAARPLSADERGYFIVQLTAPITEAKKSIVATGGVELLDYIPNYAFTVRATPAQMARAARLPEVVWIGALHPAYRIEPRLRVYSDDPATLGESQRIVINAFPGVSRLALEPELQAMGVAVEQALDDTGRWIFTGQATSEAARFCAQLNDVQWVELDGRPGPRNNTTKWTIQTFVLNDTKIWNLGLLGVGQIIGHIDGGLTTSSCYFSDPTGTPIGPLHRKIVYNGSPAADTHGTHTAGTSAGDSFPVNGSTNNRGMAPLAKIAHTSGFPTSTFNSVATTHHNNGARTHTNSWGDDSTTAYNTLCNQIDNFSWTNEDNLVMFAVTNLSTLKNPENAKNLLAVGASSNGAGANGFCSGGAGPTADGRRKPEIYAPGCNIVSANSSSCGTSSLTGTSMASPAITGGAALVREYFMDGFYPSGAAVGGDSFTPTGALVKAVLINCSEDMTGIGGYPSNTEGWGRINLDQTLFFSGDVKQLFADDVRKVNGMITGDAKIYSLPVVTSTLPLEITLAFHDFPGTSGAANPVINNLDLTVTAPNGTTVYRGNVFSGGFSTTGGVSDAKNNVERVAVLSPPPGTWIITINATNVPQQKQGYALVITGDILPPGTCSGSVTQFCSGKFNSLGCLPVIHGLGIPSSTAGSGFLITCTDARNNKPGLLFYGDNGQASIPFQGGTLCVAAPVRRTPGVNAGGNPAPADDCSGVPTLDFNAFAVGGLGGNPLPALQIPGTVVVAQWWGRDPGFPAPANTMLSDGLEFTMCP